MDNLDSELIAIILSDIEIEDYTNVRLVCKRFDQIILNEFFKNIWKWQKLFDKCCQNKVLRNKMSYAAKAGHTKLTKYFINQGIIEYNDGIIDAAVSGNMETINFFIDLIGPEYVDYDEVLYGVLKGGHQHLIKYCERKINEKTDYYDICSMFPYAINSNNVEIVKYVLKHVESKIEKEKKHPNAWASYRHAIDATDIICYAYFIKPEIIKLLLNYYPRYPENLPPNLFDLEELTKYLIDKSEISQAMFHIIKHPVLLQLCLDNGYEDYKTIFTNACKRSNWDLINKYINKDYVMNGLHWAVEYGNIDVMEYLMTYVKEYKLHIDWNSLLGTAAENGHKDLVDYCLRMSQRMNIIPIIWWMEMEFNHLTNMIEYLKKIE